MRRVLLLLWMPVLPEGDISREGVKGNRQKGNRQGIIKPVKKNIY